ncbi:hypothetical protein [Dehalococcoides mccartyi]|uniref:hypothetical protein n=1 Tax=Dehalococcoides mccartyi TaxID=61435 RepID=UPI0003C80EA4|nr:hypothetical protein [Dehalococcoides mccartyi]AHB13824.1 putative membrane protein [Dehalococcoides mccartyi GY50]
MTNENNIYTSPRFFIYFLFDITVLVLLAVFIGLTYASIFLIISRVLLGLSLFNKTLGYIYWEQAIWEGLHKNLYKKGAKIVLALFLLNLIIQVIGATIVISMNLGRLIDYIH